jgi:hypothetical protein
MNWTTEIPKREGRFWFYGDAFASDITRHCKNEIRIVRVREISNGFAYIADGNFMDNKKGFWGDEIIFPNTPETPFSPDIAW